MKKRKVKKVTFKAYEQGQGELFPGYLGDSIPEDHIVRVVDEIVDTIDTTPLIALYEGGGCSSYHPRMMLKVLLFAYTQKIYSSRHIAKALRENIFFMWLSGKNTPDFRTISDFRLKRLRDIFEDLFTGLIHILLAKGCVSMQDMFVDGTKIEADANKYTYVWRKSSQRYQNGLRKKVKELFDEIERIESEENEVYGEFDLPEMGEQSTITSEDIKALGEHLSEILKKKANRDLQKISRKIEKDLLPRMEKYEEQLETMVERNSYSKTDSDATFMRMKEDHINKAQTKPGYNIQIGTENQFVLSYGAYQKPGDTTTLIPFLDHMKEQYKTLPQNIVTDAGYGSEENYEYLEEEQLTSYVKYNWFHKEQKQKFKENKYHVQNLKYDENKDYYECPAEKKLQFTETKEITSANGYISTIRVYQCEDCTACIHREQCHKSKYNRTIQINRRLNE
jgi:transposase